MYQSSAAQPQSQPQNLLRISTVRSFEGGLNVTDTDLNMSPKFAKVLDNIERSTDGSLSLRPGTLLFSNHLASSTNVVNHVYFSNNIVAVQVDGTFNLVAGNGTSTELKIGAAKPWTAANIFCNFTIFNGNLICVNGKDKPIIISGVPTDPNYLHTQFLVDLGSLSNVNTPIAKYAVTHGQYLIMAGTVASPSTIYVSARGTSGTFPGDPAPNDAIALDLGPRVSIGSSAITGLVAYRDKLLVTFERGVLPVNLGIYTGSPSVHTPSDDGFIEEFGCLCHRSLVSVGDDTFFNDNIGINSITRINVFNTLRPTRSSHLIDPLTTAAIQPLTATQIAQYMFAVYDLRNFRYMLFVPVFAADGVTLVETVGFSYTNIPTLKINAWARLRGWRWQSACRTALQNIVFSMDNKLYVYDFDGTAHLDFVGDTTLSPSGKGVSYPFEWEMPWADFKQRMDIKIMRYIAMDTQGTAPFTMEVFVDNIMQRAGAETPLLTVDFTGGNIGGFGNQPFGDVPFGGGRKTSEERLYAITAKFKLIKLRFSGSSSGVLRFISVSLAYLMGSIRR